VCRGRTPFPTHQHRDVHPRPPIGSPTARPCTLEPRWGSRRCAPGRAPARSPRGSPAAAWRQHQARPAPLGFLEAPRPADRLPPPDAPLRTLRPVVRRILHPRRDADLPPEANDVGQALSVPKCGHIRLRHRSIHPSKVANLRLFRGPATGARRPDRQVASVASGEELGVVVGDRSVLTYELSERSGATGRTRDGLSVLSTALNAALPGRRGGRLCAGCGRGEDINPHRECCACCPTSNAHAVSPLIYPPCQLGRRNLASAGQRQQGVWLQD
jgi:hypothetical protein